MCVLDLKGNTVMTKKLIAQSPDTSDIIRATLVECVCEWGGRVVRNEQLVSLFSMITNYKRPNYTHVTVITQNVLTVKMGKLNSERVTNVQMLWRNICMYVDVWGIRRIIHIFTLSDQVECSVFLQFKSVLRISLIKLNWGGCWCVWVCQWGGGRGQYVWRIFILVGKGIAEVHTF